MTEDLTELQLLNEIQRGLKKGEAEIVLQRSLVLAERFPTHTNILIASKNIQSVAPAIETGYSDKQKVNVALVYSSTVNWIKDYLTVVLFKENLYPKIYVTPYQQTEQEILNPESGLYRFKPEVLFFHMELTSLIPFDIQYEQSSAEAVVKKIRSFVDCIHRCTKSLIVIDNFPQPAYLPIRSLQDLKLNTLKEWFNELNRALADEFQSDNSVVICDFDSLAACHGRERTVNLKLFYLAHMELSESFLPQISKKYIGYIKALKGKGRKCIVVDLDNTLWGGVIGEDGMEGIRLSQNGDGKEFYDFQRLLYSLTHRGILLAVNSKNNPDDALKVMREHSSMVLREKHFCSIKINWDNKVSNFLEIARELKIGLDSMVFWDDDPRERALVRQALPQVLVPETPKDPSEYCRFLSGLNDFEMIHFTDEDAKRTELYLEQKQREQFKENFQSLEDFLWNLEMTVRISSVTEKDLPRIAQLMQRTNQFNMTAHRYTVSELKELINSSHHLFAIHVEDRFGDSGAVGSAILEKQGRSCVIKAFLLSCRILGRGVEDYFMNHLYHAAKSEGADRLVGELIFTEKNQPARDFYEKYGFTLLKQAGDRSEWVYAIGGNQPKPVAWINAGQHVRK